uniref:Chromosome 19 open reading frame 47 n=1 Tax=Hucho hucho TaxID=62062 RepID=A0A4W5JJQ4_9TELE
MPLQKYKGNDVPSGAPGCSCSSVNMASVTTATSEWIQFFKDAGIPAGLAVNYAVSFVDNRVQKNMLMDLSKEIMMDLGITVIGDIISILKHAKQVYRQDMCKMATQAITSGQSSVQTELRRTANTPATRMIANALSRDSPPNTPAHHSDNRAISVTVSNKQAKSGKAVLSRPADEGNGLPVKRRRVTAEMEGKYIINMPKGTTARTARILAQQAKKGNKRMSVFERLGAESKADTTTGSSKATGVFSRLGRADGVEEEEGTAGRVDVDGAEEEEDDSDGEGSVLQYAGVLKRLPPSQKKEPVAPKLAPTTLRRLGGKFKLPPADSPSSSDGLPPAKLSVLQRLGKPPASPPLADTQDSRVTSTRNKARPGLALASTKVSSSTRAGGGESFGAQMDVGSINVFKRLGSRRT